MNIYFSCSITGGRADEEVYQLLVAELLRQGHVVPTAHLSSNRIMEQEAVVDPNEIYLRDMAWLEESDAVVAEVSTPSHGVGYEIAMGVALRKPVFCCYRKGRKISKIITGNNSPTITVKEYASLQEAVAMMNEFLVRVEDGRNCK